MISQKVICDVCGVEKRDTNHWYTLHLQSYTTAHFTTRLVLTQFNPVEQTTGSQKHACGQACVHKLVDRWLQTGSLEPARTPAREPADMQGGAA